MTAAWLPRGHAPRSQRIWAPLFTFPAPRRVFPAEPTPAESPSVGVVPAQNKDGLSGHHPFLYWPGPRLTTFRIQATVREPARAEQEAIAPTHQGPVCLGGVGEGATPGKKLSSRGSQAGDTVTNSDNVKTARKMEKRETSVPLPFLRVPSLLRKRQPTECPFVLKSSESYQE